MTSFESLHFFFVMIQIYRTCPENLPMLVNFQQNGKSCISLYLTTQQNEFTLFYDTVASLEQKASYLCTYRVLGEQLVEWRSSPYCKFPLSFSVFQHTLLAGLMAKMPTGSLVCDTRPWRGSLVILPYC